MRTSSCLRGCVSFHVLFVMGRNRNNSASLLSTACRMTRGWRSVAMIVEIIIFQRVLMGKFGLKAENSPLSLMAIIPSRRLTASVASIIWDGKSIPRSTMPKDSRYTVRPKALIQTNVSPVEARLTGDGTLFLDFGKVAFGTLRA